MLNLFLALLLSSFGAESFQHSQEDSEPNKLQEAADRISRAVNFLRLHTIAVWTEMQRRRRKRSSPENSVWSSLTALYRTVPVRSPRRRRHFIGEKRSSPAQYNVDDSAVGTSFDTKLQPTATVIGGYFTAFVVINGHLASTVIDGVVADMDAPADNAIGAAVNYNGPSVVVDVQPATAAGIFLTVVVSDVLRQKGWR